MKATQKSIEATVDDPEAALDTYLDEYSDADEDISKTELKVVLPLVEDPEGEDKPIGWMNPDAAESSSKLLGEYGALDKPADIEDIIDNDFIE